MKALFLNRTEGKKGKTILIDVHNNTKKNVLRSSFCSSFEAQHHICLMDLSVLSLFDGQVLHAS